MPQAHKQPQSPPKANAKPAPKPAAPAAEQRPETPHAAPRAAPKLPGRGEPAKPKPAAHSAAPKAAARKPAPHPAATRAKAKPAAHAPAHGATRPKPKAAPKPKAKTPLAGARRGRPQLTTRAVAVAAGGSLQQRVYEMVRSRSRDDRVMRAVFLLCTAENDWNTETCNSSDHCGLFQLDRDWQRQHNYRDIGYWLQYALDHGFYSHGGIISIAARNPSYSIGGIVQACQGAGPTWDAAVAYYNSRLRESDAILARYRGRSAPVAPPRELYFNPLAHARVRSERIDQGVDYAGTGYLTAIADGKVGISIANGSGWEGEGYLNYQITQPGPLHGVWIYYAEGITPVVHSGELVRGGSRLCDLRSYQPHGIEIGFAAGYGELSYYAYHDGHYSEGTATRPGIAFSNLVKRLGGPGGVIEGPVVGKFPEYMQSGVPAGAISTRPESGGAGGGIIGYDAPGAASEFGWPAAYYSAIVQLQRGIGAGAHHSHAAWHHLHGITEFKPRHSERKIRWPTIRT